MGSWSSWVGGMVAEAQSSVGGVLGAVLGDSVEYEWLGGNLEGRVYVITGANQGLGFEAAQMLAERGATVVLACRNQQRMDDAQRKIDESLISSSKASEGGKVVGVLLDLSEMESVKSFPARFSRTGLSHINGLLLNAAAAPGSLVNRVTNSQGWEIQTAVNTGHFALTNLLMADLLEAQRRFGLPSRVAMHSSFTHSHANSRHPIDLDAFPEYKGLSYGFTPMNCYIQTKCMQILHMHELNRRLAAAGLEKIVQAVSCHPGIADTGVWRNYWMLYNVFLRPFTLSARQGSLPLVRCVLDFAVKPNAFLHPERQFLSGQPYTVQVVEAEPSQAMLRDLEQGGPIAQDLWERLEVLTGTSLELTGTSLEPS